jgi:hypothetical protein
MTIAMTPKSVVFPGMPQTFPLTMDRRDLGAPVKPQ